MDWKLQWEQLVIEDLQRHNIVFEKTSFKISPDLKKGRDFDWEKNINSGQLVTLILPARKGGKLQVQSINDNSLPVNVGSIEFYNQDIDFQKGIVCQLINKELVYANGDKRACLEFDQPIILINSDKIPDEILFSETLKIKDQAKKTSFGCLPQITTLAMILLVLTLLVYIAC